MGEIETIGKYEIISVLGKGGMGVVYKARDPFIDRIVAVKTIRITPEMEEEDLGARLEMEAKSAGRLQHPNICTVYDFGLQSDVSYIVLEYAEGGDLSQVIDRKLDLSLPQKIDIIIQIALGLDYAHSMGVVHRDMKPANVRLTREGVAKLIDFGLARFDTTRLTKTGFMSGTIAYMSPERINGESGESDDIFALGTLAWELLTYERAFPGTAPPEVMFKILSKSPDPPSSLIEAPPELDEIILRCMARDKAERYQTAGDFAYDLQDLVASADFREFLSSEERSEGFQRALKDWEEAISQGNRSSDSRIRTRAGRATSAPTPSGGIDFQALDTVVEQMPASGQIKTVVEPSREASDDATVVEPAAVADATVVEQAGEKAPATEMTEAPAATVIERIDGRDERRSRKGLMAGAAAIVTVAALAGVGYTQFSKSGADEDPPPLVNVDPELGGESVIDSGGGSRPDTQTDEDETPDMAAMIAWQTESKLVERLKERIPDSDLSAAERTAYRAAVQLQGTADRLFQDGDASGAAEAMAEAGIAFEQIAEDYDARKRSEAASEAARGARAERRTQPEQPRRRETVSSTPVVEESEPEPERPVRRPDPEPPAPVEPAGPTPEQLRTEVRSFVSELESAYRSKNAGFFRDRYDGFNQAIGNAVAASPSDNVTISIKSVSLSGDDRATVRVSRTDTFPDRNIPPATQNLVYEVRKANGQWRLVSFSRE